MDPTALLIGGIGILTGVGIASDNDDDRTLKETVGTIAVLGLGVVASLVEKKLWPLLFAGLIAASFYFLHEYQNKSTSRTNGMVLMGPWSSNG